MKRYPNYPGHDDSDTSKEAAEAIAPHINRLQQIALTAIRESGGLTREELSDKTGNPPASIHPRVSELKKMGLIRDSGLRRRNRSGKRAIVCVAVQQPPADQSCTPDNNNCTPP